MSNIAACIAIGDTVATTLGPRGMDKLVIDGKGESHITNDGATIVKMLDVVHPAARIMIDVAKSQDAEIGDGTTSVVLFAAQILKEVKGYIEDGVSSKIIVQSLREAVSLVRHRLHIFIQFASNSSF